MSVAVQLLINGLIAGAVYALVAAGFSLIYSTCRFVHFSHGAVVAFSAYMLYLLFTVLSLDFWLSAILSIALASGLGLLMNLTVYRQLRKRKASGMVLLLSSVGLLIFLESAILLFFGAGVKTIGLIRVARGMDFLGAVITPLQVVIIASSLSLLISLFLFMKGTKIGKAMRAVSDNRDVAEVVGISSERIYSWSFAIGSAIAGFAGILVGLEQNLEPTMGTSLIIKGFTGSVIGGIGSVAGAILGAFLLGMVENVGIWFLPSGYKDAISFVILFAFLLFRPRGLLGIRRSGK